MANQDIIQNMISRLGQSQNERLPAQLGRHFVDIDERDGRALLDQTVGLAKLLSFYGVTPDAPSGRWDEFLADAVAAPSIMDSVDGNVAPHLGLLGAFFRLYRHPQRVMNEITGRHLDFQFRTVLGFEPRRAVPDRAHVVVELKKGAAPVRITESETLGAGKDATGQELVYQPVRDVIVTGGRVAAVTSVFVDGGGVHFSPVANSADGFGAELDVSAPSWSMFGTAGTPVAPIGFALGSSVLAMQEGTRQIFIELQLAAIGGDDLAEVVTRSFEAYLTGPQGWIGPFEVHAAMSGGLMTIRVDVGPTDPAIVPYSRALHTHSFGTVAPVVQLLLKASESASFGRLAPVIVERARVRVSVEGMTTLVLENDQGSLNPKKPFLPFGAVPVAGSTFSIGCQEALSKDVTELSIRVRWQGAPTNLAGWYAGYCAQERIANGVGGMLAYQDRTGQVTSIPVMVLAGVNDGTSVLSPTPPPSVSSAGFQSLGQARVMEWSHLGGELGRERVKHASLLRPSLRMTASAASSMRAGFVTLMLKEDFLHTAFRGESVRNTMAFARASLEYAAADPSSRGEEPPRASILNEPYTPVARSISMDYSADSGALEVGDGSEGAFTGSDLAFFQVGCFGQRRDHAHVRRAYSYIQDVRVPLMPQYPNEGELCIGVVGVGPGDPVSLLFQAEEGSGDPDAPPQRVAWSVLGENYWRPLEAEEITADTTHELRRTGVVQVALPRDARTEHTIMPTGMVWLRAAVKSGASGLCRLVAVMNNAVEVMLQDHGNDPARVDVGLPAGAISKMRVQVPGVKGVAQPYAGLPGRGVESDGLLTRRASERLRHRQRCITPWDYERMLLEEFPEIHRVKCVPHANGASWMAPGHVLVVVVPKIRGRRGVDPLRPRFSLDALTRFAEFAQGHSGGQVVVKATNAVFQRVQVECMVRFVPGSPFNFNRARLNDDLVRSLSPWAFGDEGAIRFGGEVYRSALLKIVEKLPYVDFVTNFKMRTMVGAGSDQSTISAETPDAILVSAASHVVTEYVESKAP